MASKPIIVRVGVDDDNNPKILEPSMSSSQSVPPGPVTWQVYNSCPKIQLWIQFQGFFFTPDTGTPPLHSITPDPMLFGSSMSFGAELNIPEPNTPPEPQTVTTPPTFPTAAADSKWTYSILLFSHGGVVDTLDPIIVLSG